MSTNVRKSAAVRRKQQADPAEQLREAWSNAKEAVRTGNGQFFLGAAKFLVSLLSLLYFKGVIRMAYYSMFYRLEIPQDHRGLYCFLVTMVCIFFGAVMLFTRKQIVTRLVIMCSMPFYLPIILFNYRHLVLLVPLMLMVTITYLASGTSEGPKTIFGAIFIMLYILGAFVFLTVQGIIQPAVKETVVERDVTPKGNYRYSVVQVEDQGEGNTYVSVEPNTADVDYKHCTWFAKGYAHEVYHERPLDTFKTEWTVQSRAEITRELITHNPNTTFVLDAEQMKLLGLNVGYAEDFTIGKLTRKQRHKLGFGSEKDPIDSRFAKFFRVSLVEPDYTVSLDFDKMVELGLKPTYSLRLSRMSDENLAALGVPEENEVLTVNGKVVFREYVAVLQREFDPANRDMMAFLESNIVPPVNPEGLDLDAIRAERAAQTSAKTTTTVTTTTTTVDEDAQGDDFDF